MQYVELRHHTEFSIGVGCGKLEDHVARVEKLGLPAVCLSEVGTMRQVHALYDACSDSDVRPIYGVELWVAKDHRRRGLTENEERAVVEGVKNAKQKRKAIAREERRLGIDRTWKVCAIAETDEGLANLFRLTSIGWVDGSYRKTPRVDVDLLEKYSEGVILLLGGEDGLVTEQLLRGENRKALETLNRLSEVFDDRLYLEIRPHSGANHRKLNRAVVMVSNRFDVPLVATNDVHYVAPDDVDAHTVVLCLAIPRMTFEDRSHPRSSPGHHVRTAEEMVETFASDHPDISRRVVVEAVERTVEVAERCCAKLNVDPHRGLIPDLGLDVHPFVELKRLCIEGWSWRDIPTRATFTGVSMNQYTSQLTHELRTFRERGIEAYFLFVRDVVQWARSQGIMVGPGRGSAAGSLVSYLLGITSIDPLEHGLMFERFIAPGRIDMPDIDVDFQKSRREEVIDYVREKYGDDRVAHIATFGRMHGRGALKDVCRVLDVPYAAVNAVTATFPSRQGDEKRAVRDVLEGSEKGREFTEKYPQVLPLVERLEGSVRQIGVHAAGIVACPVPLPEVCPVELHERKGVTTKITALDMDGVGDLGALKLDALALKHLDILSDTRDAVEERTGEHVDFERLTFDDPDVLEAFTRQEFIGVFQYDAQSARSVTKDLEFTKFGDVSALTALNRPGCTRSGLTERFRKRRQDPEAFELLHPTYDNITEDTLGVLVYQEQVIKLFRDLAGYTPAEADKMRKVIGKKLGAEEVEKHREKFVQGAFERGMEEDDANTIMDQLLAFASYAFNLAHAASYAAIAYWEMWCKVHHPTEFVWALMRNADDSDEALGYVNEARRLGVLILTPDVNESGGRWTLVEGGIRTGLSDVKHVGKAAVKAIEAAQPFDSISDFIERVPARAANAKVMQSLVKAGAMRSLLPNTKWAIESGWLVDARKAKKRKTASDWAERLDRMARGSADEDDYDDEDLLAFALKVIPQGAGQHPMELYDALFCEEGIYSKVDWLEVGDPDFWSHRGAFVKGVIIDVKFRVVGDFGVSEPDEVTKRKKQWGRRYAQVHLEGREGGTQRIKFEPDVFDRFRDVLERGKGTSVAMHVSLLPRWRSVRAHYVIDLEEVRQKLRLNIPFSGWERCFTADHPVQKYSRKSLLRRRSRSFEAVGLIIYSKCTLDRNENEMAFFGLQDGHGNHVEVVAFSSVYEAHGDAVVVGSIVEVSLRKDGRSVLLTDEGILDELSKI